VLKLQRSVYYYHHRRDPQTELRLRLKDLAAARVRYGYERLHTLLRREGWQINLKRVYRLYHEEGLSLRLKKRRRNASANDACRSRGPLRPMNAGAWILCTIDWLTGVPFAC
jgi:putative transposase